MAECSYARCLQERRLIKRELMKWSKDMLHIVGLERVAEELMGHRKWKYYHETLTRTHLSTDQLTATIDQLNLESKTRDEHDLKLDNNCSDSKEKTLLQLQQQEHQQQQQQQEEGEQEQQHQVTSQQRKDSRQQSYEGNHCRGDEEGKETVDQAKKHHRAEEDGDALIKQETETERDPEVQLKSATGSKRAGNEDYSNSNTVTSHNHSNNNNTNNTNNNNTTTTVKTETTHITDDADADDTLRLFHHSELLANLRLRKVQRSAPSIPSVSASASIVSSSAPPPLPLPPPPTELEPEPIDWRPNEKCYFCLDGKLLTVNARGELVAEAGSALSEADHAHRQIIDTESDSNDSFAHTTTPTSAARTATVQTAASPGGQTNQRGAIVNKLLASRLRDLPANMTSMDSMAARLAAIRTISGQLYPNLDFNWLLAQQQQQQQHQQQQQQQQQQTNAATPTTSDTAAVALSPALAKDSPSSSDATGEQPLDLSSKPSPNSSISGDLKTSTRTKSSSRTTPLPPPGRRTYSDDDLNCALQDVISGKLGTRKAAVQYNIPRSTLRNKVYKLTMDEKRIHAPAPTEMLQQLHRELELDRDALSADEGEDESSDSTTHAPPPLDDLASRIAASATLRELCEANSSEEAHLNDRTSPKQVATSTAAAAATAALEQLKRQSGTPHSVANLPQTSPQPQLAPILIDPNVLLQTLLLSAGALQNPALQPKLDESVTLRDLFGAILFNSGINLKDALAANPAPAAEPAKNDSGKPPNLMEQRLLLQQLQQPGPAHAHAHFAHRLPKSDTPETSSSLDLNEASDDPSVILKIPSYKPVAGSCTSAAATATTTSSALSSSAGALHCSNNSSSTRNIDSPHSQSSAPSPRIATSMLAAAVVAAGGSGNAAAAHHQPNSMSVISPPLMRHNLSADSQSPPAFSLRDVIANSIHRTMNEQANKDAHAAAASMLGLGSGVDSERSAAGDYKTPSISVVKNIGGTDTSRFGKAPNLLASAVASSHNSHQQHHHHHHPHHHLQHPHHSSHHLSRQEAAALAAGKGTRPKRGKYRNYDRDSLVEAVKAVQRGEMSVHRAGSYYGVPHSTLEYKVKERHLMRPRKREPKPQPLDSSGTTATTSSSKANSNIPSHSTANNLDKLKAGTAAASTSKLSGALKNNSSGPAFPNTSPNGMKLPMFDPNVAAAQLQYAPHLFWSHSAAAFGPLQMDFNRSATQSGTASTNVATSTPSSSASPYVNADILKSHIQRYQEESMRSAGGSASCSTNTHNVAHTPSPVASPMSGQNHHALHYKSTRELAENLYDGGSSANGSTSSSFLDGIIRKTLDRKNNDVTPSSGALLDQLLVKKMPRPFPNNRSNDYAISTTPSGAPLKRSGSPLQPQYPSIDIKRERNSPLHSDAEETSNSEADERSSNNNNNSSSRISTSNVARLSQMQQQQQRCRMASRDSDTDGSSGSLKSGMTAELLSSSQHYNNNIIDLNGGGATGTTKMEMGSVGTSILQEKLGQIKSERDTDENL